MNILKLKKHKRKKPRSKIGFNRGSEKRKQDNADRSVNKEFYNSQSTNAKELETEDNDIVERNMSGVMRSRFHLLLS